MAADNDDLFYEIEYDSCPMPGVGKYVLKSRRIGEPKKDEIRERFDRMRDIARRERTSYYGGSRFYDRRIRQENSRIFYKQGKFMEDFADDCDRVVSCKAYFPDYQMMGYDQLRTYFTWRTKVRQGEIQNISLSYAFLYLYELLNNIGVEGPGEGLDALLDFWDVFRFYDETIDKYMIRWMKDYHIYYELPWSFREFVDKNNLASYYPELADPADRFGLFCTISRYDIRKSGFFTDERRKLIRGCFNDTMEALARAMEQKNLSLDAFVFHTARKMPEWTPFKEALFYPHIRQRDRQVVLSEKEIYLCSQDKWSCSTAITMESGRGLVGYVMKQMEALLRRTTGYKYKLSAHVDMISDAVLDTCAQAGLSIEQIVTENVLKYYREATRTEVKIDESALERIRKEALITQEKLIVPEEESTAFETVSVFSGEDASVPGEEDSTRGPEKDSFSWDSFSGEDSSWKELKDVLDETEKQALALILKEETAFARETALRHLTDERGMMLEVLIDGINEKAMDYVGDSLLDEEYAVYEEYTEQAEKISREI